MGRTLDAIAAFGPTELFNHIVTDCLKRDQFAINLVNVDTTNFSVYGDYDSDSNTEKIEITYGHPKDGRWDLKRFVLGWLPTNMAFRSCSRLFRVMSQIKSRCYEW